ncbi:MAG: hypothetical protein WC868_02240 [Bacteroidales bacterium]
MNKNYTFNDLIFLAYNETDEKNAVKIRKALNNNEELRNEYQSILNAQNILDKLQQEPSEKTISNILGYSKALNVFTLKPDVNTGFFIVN